MKLSREEKIASKIIAKWLHKGNMARAMRDILPSSRLDAQSREKVAQIVHDIVRVKNLYDYALGGENRKTTPENYVLLRKRRKIVEKYRVKAMRENLPHIYFSSSMQVAKIIANYPDFGEKINRERETNLAVNINKIEREEAREILEKENIKTSLCHPETCLAGNSNARYSSLIEEGLAIVQDSSSQQLAKLTASLGDEILDFCAGSGGKSFTMKFFNPSAKIKVHDANEKKIDALFRRAEKLKLEFERFDHSGKFQVVLVDAPCSGLGSVARNPEAKYREDLDTFPPMQIDILRQASKFVEEGGFLVYSVCTFNPEETYGVVERFLTMGEFEEMEIGSRFMKREKHGGFITSGDIIYVALLRKI